MEVEMKIRGLMMDPVTNMPIVVLKDINGNAILPIWVGIYEANAIALEIEKVSTPRPMTHDLIKTLLLGLGTGIRKVVVSELKDDTFYAVIWLDKDGELISVDSRPSDALALALRLDCPIYVDESVLKSSKIVQRRRRQDQQRRTAPLARKPGRRGSRPLQDVNERAREPRTARGIQIIPAEIASHFILERDGFVCLRRAPRRHDFGNIGAPGLMTERGFAALIWRGDQAFFVGKGFEQPASAEQVQKLRAFAADLEKRPQR